MSSWAVPKGPSMDPSEKRLAMEVEGNPRGYMDFEGTIPKGEYGGGRVLIRERGTSRLLEKENDKVVFFLKGEKLRGLLPSSDSKGVGREKIGS